MQPEYRTGNPYRRRSSLSSRPLLERRCCFALRRKTNKRVSTRASFQISPISESMPKMRGFHVAQVVVVVTDMITATEEVEEDAEVTTNRGTSKRGEEEEVGDQWGPPLEEGEAEAVTIIAVWMTLEVKCSRVTARGSRMRIFRHYRRHIKSSRLRARELNRATTTMGECHPAHKAREEEAGAEA